ncbi:MAG: OmpH family outer membrane protein [Candidatus Omnitrophota bacterium]
MIYIKVLFLAVFLLSGTIGPAAAQEARKIAFISLSKAFDSYEKTKAVDKELESKGEKKNKDRDKLVQKINKLRDEAQLMSKDARQEKERELSDLMRELQDFDREARVELQRDRDDRVKEIFKEMDGVISDYGKQNGYDIIFDDRVLLYASDKIDITEEIIKTLNKR